MQTFYIESNKKLIRFIYIFKTLRDKIAFVQKRVFYCLMIATCDGHFIDTMQFCFRHVLDNLCTQATLFTNHHRAYQNVRNWID